MWTFSCGVLFGSRLVPLWFPLRFPLVVQLPLDFLSVQGGHTGKMPVVALACVVLQQDKVLTSPARTGRFAEVPDVNWQMGVWRNPAPLATWWLHDPKNNKPRYLFDSGVSLCFLVGPARFELATNGLKVHSPIKHPCGFPADFGNINSSRHHDFMRLLRLYSRKKTPSSRSQRGFLIWAALTASTAPHSPAGNLFLRRLLRWLLGGREHGVVRLDRVRRCHGPRCRGLNRWPRHRWARIW